MKLNTNSNSYIIAYASLTVVVVAFILAFVFQILKPLQEKNVSLDKKRQILAALNIRDIDNNQVEAEYKSIIEADEVLDSQNKIILPGQAGGESDGFKLDGGDNKKGKLALFVCKVNNQKKFVIPVYGMGLWGNISGYIAINEDKETIYGVYFNHESETAGLGAEIKDNRKWQEQFKGKHLFSGNSKDKIALSICKKVDNPSPNQVDGVTGATLTCDGVNNMLHDGIAKYLVFLKNK